MPTSAGASVSITRASARAPWTRPQGASPAALPPAASAASHRRAAVAGWCRGDAATLRWCRCSRWPYSSQRNSSGQLRVTWLSEPMAMGTPACSQPSRSVRPSPRLPSVPGQMMMPAPLRATSSISAAVVWVACTSCQRASGLSSWHNHAIGRWPVALRQSATSWVCSATWMCTGTASSPTSHNNSVIAAGLAARSEWMATPALTRGWSSAWTSRSSWCTRAGVLAKRCWSARNVGCEKPARS